MRAPARHERLTVAERPLGKRRAPVSEGSQCHVTSEQRDALAGQAWQAKAKTTCVRNDAQLDLILWIDPFPAPGHAHPRAPAERDAPLHDPSSLRSREHDA